MGKRIGIVTLVGSYNYGNRLQNYAVTKIYEKVGCDVITLRYSHRSFSKKIRTSLSLLLHGNRKTQVDYGKQSKERVSAFAEFDKAMEFISLDTIDEALTLGIDFFSVGSDQVWNPRYMTNAKWYFLEFAVKEKRIALSPSFGVESIPNSYKHSFRKGLSGFYELSVREYEGAALIKDLIDVPASVLVDPTLVLDKSEWQNVSNSRLNPSNKYTFAYLLGQTNEQIERLEEYVRSVLGMEFVLINDLDDGSQLPAGPAEFVSLIDNAEYVFTDSFHACVFSSIFDKKLYVLSRSGSSDMSSRISSLIVNLSLESSQVKNDYFDARHIRCTDNTKQRIKDQRQSFYSYIENALSRFSRG